jgi:hypothetical protein
MCGPQLLLQLYKLPTIGYDFPSSSAAFSMSHLFRVMSEVNTSGVVQVVLEELKKELHVFSDHIPKDEMPFTSVKQLQCKY